MPPEKQDEQDGARTRLVDRHGWFAQLAIAQTRAGADPAMERFEGEGVRALIALAVAGAVVLLAGAAGFVLFVLTLVLLGNHTLWWRYPRSAIGVRPVPTALLEAVVLFLVGFLVVQMIGALVEAITGVSVMAGLIWLMPLVMLWPLARGVRWDELRLALGWHRGEGVFKEISCGVAGYLAGLPLMGVGILIVLALTMLTQTQATHPIKDQLGIKSVWDAMALYLLAAVWAPLVEESVFRGALFHHMRQGAGIVASAALTAFIFAVIHPQGFVGVPVLMALAVTFALLREWRGSIIASITAHALNNAFVVTLLVVLVS